MRTLHVANFLNPDLLHNNVNNNQDDNPYVHHMADVSGHNNHDIALLVANSLSASPAPPNDPKANHDSLPGSHDISRPPSAQPPSAATAQGTSETSLSPEGQHQVQQAQMAIQSILDSVNVNHAKDNSGLDAPSWRNILSSHSPDPSRSAENGQRSKENNNGIPQEWGRFLNSHSPVPPPESARVASSAEIPQASSSKRVLEDPEDDEVRAKIRKTVQDNVTAPESNRVVNMTTVVCLHAAVAQKSYGSEKRFLTPPPLVRVEGPYGSIPDQRLAMRIVGESGERGPEAVVPLDQNLMAAFKFLHVTGAAKAKSFNLALEIARTEGSNRAQPWACFESAPVTIISKPSKKTAKTRNIASCILAGGPVSLFNRINSQTVRTKYMTIDSTHLCASNVLWSAFNVNVIQRGSDPTPLGQPQPVTYGAEITLSDSLTGIGTSSLFVKKIDKGRISTDEGGPVSQMQKIALLRVDDKGQRHYLSAISPHTVPGNPGSSERASSSKHDGNTQNNTTHHLLFQSARTKEEHKEDGTITYYDEVDDYLSWTIVGISKFQYTFFDALGQNDQIPELPITPFPTLFQAPIYRVPSHTLDLTISSFYYENPKTGGRSPLEIWLGDIGPLTHRVCNAPPTGINNMFMEQGQPGQGQNGNDSGAGVSGEGSPQQQSPGGFAQAAAAQAQQMMPPAPQQPQFMQPGPLHTNVLVDLPPIQDIMKALQNDVQRAAEVSDKDSGEPSTSGTASNPPDSAVSASDASSHPHLNFVGRSLPLLFIRGADGIGYHSGRTIALDNLYVSVHQNGPSGAPQIQPDWMITAATAATIDGNLQGWTLKVI